MKLTRIAMWSGPRNISTAMLRSWENRADTVVVDEPLYGPYLFQTGKRHPMYQEIINEQGNIINPSQNDSLLVNFRMTLAFFTKNTWLTIFWKTPICHGLCT